MSMHHPQTFHVKHRGIPILDACPAPVRRSAVPLVGPLWRRRIRWENVIAWGAALLICAAVWGSGAHLLMEGMR